MQEGRESDLQNGVDKLLIQEHHDTRVAEPGVLAHCKCRRFLRVVLREWYRHLALHADYILPPSSDAAIAAPVPVTSRALKISNARHVRSNYDGAIACSMTFWPSGRRFSPCPG